MSAYVLNNDAGARCNAPPRRAKERNKRDKKRAFVLKRSGKREEGFIRVAAGAIRINVLYSVSLCARARAGTIKILSAKITTHNSVRRSRKYEKKRAELTLR